MSDSDNSEIQDAAYYLVFLHPVPERPLSSELMDIHAAHLAELDDCGKLLMAGRLVERAGELIVLRAANAAEAMSIAEEDPLVRCACRTYELATWLMINPNNGYRPDTKRDSKK